LEAALIFLQISFPLVHELNDLRDRLPEDWAVKNEYPDLKQLSYMVFRGRYPGDWIEPDEADAAASVEQARGILESIQADLRLRGLPQQ
jgi:HEPN domain-containing protein